MNNHNPPAFPFVYQSGITNDIPDIQVFTGMGLRDYFAACAINGIFVMQTAIKTRGGKSITPAEFAIGAYEIADAMLNERNKTP